MWKKEERRYMNCKIKRKRQEKEDKAVSAPKVINNNIQEMHSHRRIASGSK
jgi:hypothetical protein